MSPICIDQEVEVVHHPVAHHSENHIAVSLLEKYPGSSEVIGGKMQRMRALNEWAINFSKQLATSGDTVGGHVPAALLNGLTEVHGDGPTQSTILVKDVGTGSALEEPTALKTSSAKTL
ncbi:hypothetical protein V6N11_022330 [Hibiscus sabdariffa]|uniref:Uncharacterized protein n=1 Tax=Hibiscus sabdariffa TaxID=183260 RepID=A0ABR2TJL1_9ROSI